MARSSGERPVAVYAALAANLCIAIAKFIAAAVTGSSAILSEGIHSASDTGNELLLLWGLRRSRRPPGAMHPYGHGKELYFWSLIVAIVLFSLGGGMSIYEGILHLLHPKPIKNALLSYIVLGIAFAFELTSFSIALHKLREAEPDHSLWQAMRASKDPSVFMVVGEDLAALIGVLAAALGITLALVTGIPAFDGAGSLLVGVVLCTVSFFLASESHALLVGESAGRKLASSLRELTRHDPAVRAVGEPLTMQLGPQEVLLNLELEFRPELGMAEARSAVDRIEATLRTAHPEVTRIFLAARSFPRQAGLPKALAPSALGRERISPMNNSTQPPSYGTQPSNENWARYTNAALGAWLFVSAFLWTHSTNSQTNSWIVGLLMLVVSLVGVRTPNARWLNTATAAWLFISTLVIVHATAATMWNNLIVAVIAFALSFFPSHSIPSRDATSPR